MAAAELWLMLLACLLLCACGAHGDVGANQALRGGGAEHVYGARGEGNDGHTEYADAALWEDDRGGDDEWGEEDHAVAEAALRLLMRDLGVTEEEYADEINGPVYRPVGPHVQHPAGFLYPANGFAKPLHHEDTFEQVASMFGYPRVALHAHFFVRAEEQGQFDAIIDAHVAAARHRRRKERGLEEVHPFFVEECVALIDFYRALNGPAWTHVEPWWFQEPTACCDWGNNGGGVFCYPDTDERAGHVSMISLSGRGVAGVLPDDVLPRLPMLDVLMVREGDLQGTIWLPPNMTFVSLSYHPHLEGIVVAPDSQLDFLGATHSGLTSMPRLEHCHSLRTLMLNNNKMEGSVGRVPTTTSSVELSFNRLSGTLPVGSVPLNGRAAGSAFAARGNNLRGGLPEELFETDTCRLYLFEVDHNQLSGTLPVSLTRCFSPASPYSGSTKSQLQLNYNELSGELPAEMVDVHVARLGLAHNNFHGAIPSNWTYEMMFVSVLDVSHNALTSVDTAPIAAVLQNYASNRARSISATFLAYTLAHYINVANNAISSYFNQLTGSNNPAVFFLSMANNAVSGTVPIGGLPNLVDVDFSSNKLTNLFLTYPVTQVVSLHVENNELAQPVGLIDFVTITPNLRLLYLNNNMGITGPLPGAWKFLPLAEVHVQDTQMHPPVQSTDLPPYYKCRPVVAGAEKEVCLPTFLDVSTVGRAANKASELCYSLDSSSGLDIVMDLDYFGDAACLCQKGFFRDLHANNTCVRCLENGVCDGGVDETRIVAMTGFWGSPDHIHPREFLRCVFEAGCHPRVDKHNRHISPCAEGYEGRLCGTCEHGYFRWGMQCSECSSSRAVQLLIPILTMLAIILFAVFLYRAKGSSTGVLKIALFYVQTVSLASRLRIELPRTYLGLSQGSGFASLRIAAVDCLLGRFDYKDTFYFTMSLPLVAAVATLLVWAVGVVALQMSRQQRHDWKLLNVRVMLLLWFSAYYEVAVMVLQTLRCDHDPHLGHTYFHHAPNMRCDTISAHSMRAVAAAGVAIYVAGIPVLLFALVRRHSTFFRSARDQRIVAGWIGECFSSKYWYWEFVVLARRLLLVITVSFGHSNSTFPLFIVFAVLFLSLGLQQHFNPYKKPSDSQLEKETLVVLVVTNTILLSIVRRDAQTTDEFAVSEVLIMVINVLMVLHIVVELARMQGGRFVVFFRRMRERKQSDHQLSTFVELHDDGTVAYRAPQLEHSQWSDGEEEVASSMRAINA